MGLKMNIFIKGIYTIQGRVDSEGSDSTIELNVPMEDKPEVVVNINMVGNVAESLHETEITGEMWSLIQQFQKERTFDSNNVAKKVKDELLEIRFNNENATKKVLYLIKYGFSHTNIDDNLLLLKNLEWSIDKSEWDIMPHIMTSTLDIRTYIKIHDKNLSVIQQYLLDDYKPFLALHHLHKAINETNPRYKYIDATIAAELAIKEFLANYVSNIEPFLMEVPSPPLYKLYGPILEHYTGEKSPKLKEIKNGVEIRNKLVHKPNEIIIDKQTANNYVHDMKIAIYHLLSLLYPKDIPIDTLYKQNSRIGL